MPPRGPQTHLLHHRPLAGLPRILSSRLTGNLGDTALVIELARASEIAPIIVQSYALSPREQQITQLIAQGVTTAGIARRLYLLTHTVRDYIKAILTKVGVSSRGELVATLFAVHDRTIRHHDDVERVSH